MISFNATQIAIAAATSKPATWLFEVTDNLSNVYYWSTKAYTYGGQAYAFKVLPDSFDGVTLNRSKSEMGIQAPSDLSFDVTNKNDTYSAADFIDGTVLVKLVVKAGANETIMRQWKFRIKDAISIYQKMTLDCEDYLQAFLAGDYPNTPFVKSLFQGSDATIDDNVCVPVPFGTAYVPLRSVYVGDSISLSGITFSTTASSNGSRCLINDSASGFANIEVGRVITVAGFTDPANNGDFQVLARTAGVLEISKDAGLVTEAAGDAVTIKMGTRYYILGASARTYTISAVRSPRECGVKSEWTAAGGFTFTQSTLTDADAVTWKAFQPIICDVDIPPDGTADAPGFWISGDVFYDMPTKFSRDDTVSTTNPADVIEFVLKDMGVPAGDIDAVSFAAAKTVYAGWGLTFNGAFWYKQKREAVLSILLNMCHSYLTFTNTIGLNVRSKTSRATIGQSSVTKQGGSNSGFSYRGSSLKGLSNCGHVSWQPTGEAQDKFLVALVPVKASKTVISSESIEIPFVQDSQDIQRIGTLYYQRKLAKMAEISFPAKATLLKLEPEDVISINYIDYGGSYDVVIDSLTITRDLTLKIKGIRFAIALDDWGDLAPSAITVYSEDTTQLWQPPVSGPLSEKDLGMATYYSWGKEYLTVSPVKNAGEFDTLQKALNAVAQAGGGDIYLLNGTHAPAGIIYWPNVNFTIKGQSRADTIITPAHDTALFKLPSLWSKKVELGNFSIVTNNNAATKVIDLSRSLETAEVTLENIYMSLSGTSTSDIDTGIYTEYNINLNLFNTIIENGTYGINILGTNAPHDHGDILIDKACRFINQLYAINIVGSIKRFRVLNSFMTDVRKFLFYIDSSAQPMGEFNCSNNVMKFKETVLGASCDLAYITGAIPKTIISSNDIAANPTDNNLAFIIVDIVGVHNAVIQGNSIRTEVSTDQIMAAFRLANTNNANVTGNNILIDNGDNTSNRYGIYMQQACRNILAGNNINMVNGNAKDIGIALDANSQNNSGQDNLFYNCGTNISDAGTGNLINKSGGGTF